MAELKLKQYMFTFEGGGWNTVWAKTLKGAKKLAVKEYEYSDTLNAVSYTHLTLPTN